VHRSRLPILSPCDQSWEAMSGTGAQRHCAACDRDVLDLSAMPAEAAIDALIARDGRTCIRYRTDAVGEIQFAKPPPRRPNPVAVAALALTACAGWADDPATIAPDELGQCIPGAADPNQCDLPASQPREPDAPDLDAPKPTNRDSTAPLDVQEPPASRDFTALVELSPTVTGDTAGIRVEDLHRMKSELTDPYRPITPNFGSVETTIWQGEWEDGPTLETSLFNRESSKARATIRSDTSTERGGTKADLRRMRRELRRSERQKRRRG